MRRKSHPFWRFSLGIYARAGVEHACLALQTSCGADVNLLLYCCWMARSGRPLSKRFLRRAVAAVSVWQTQVVQPLRRVRHAIKKGVSGLPKEWQTHLRKSASAAELDAEYVEQLVLAALAAEAPVRKLKPETAAVANIESYLELLGVPFEAAARRHAQTLLAACFAEGIA